MITKAIIERIINDYSAVVRIPIMDKIVNASTGSPIGSCQTATECTLPNFKYNFNVGDIVFVDFEENNLDNPVIIGNLLGFSEKRPDCVVDSLDVKGKSVFPKGLSIGDVSFENIETLKGVSSNIQKSIDSVKNKTFEDEITSINRSIEELKNSKNDSDEHIKVVKGLMSVLDEMIGNNDSEIYKKINNTLNHLSTAISRIGKINGSAHDALYLLMERVKALEESYANGYDSIPHVIPSININDDEKPFSSFYKCIMYDSYNYKNAVSTNMTPVGVLWHDTGAGNPNVKRYVQPSKSDENYTYLLNLLGKNTEGNDWNTYGITNPNHKSGVNAFIGKLADKSVASVQTLPWSWRPNGCGSGINGSCNNGWLQFEICDDGYLSSVYFRKIYDEAIKLTAFLCMKFNIDPKGYVVRNGISIPTILCHYDSHLLGFGSNHGDVYSWFDKFGKTMEDVRNDVSAFISQSQNQNYDDLNWISKLGRREQYLTESEMQNNASVFYAWAKTKGWSVASIAGILGCMEAESNINPSCKNYSEMDRYNNENYGIGLTQWTNTPLATATSGRHKDMVDWVEQNYYTWASGIGQSEYLLIDLYNRKTNCSITQLTSMIPSDLQHKNGEDFAKCSDSRWTAQMAAAWFLGCYTAGFGNSSSQSYYDAHWDTWFSSRSRFADKWYNYLINL